MANEERTPVKKRPATEGDGPSRKPVRRPSQDTASQKRPGSSGESQSRTSSSGPSRPSSSSESRPQSNSSGEQRPQRESSPGPSTERSSAPRSSENGLTAGKAARRAMEQLQELTSREVEGVVGIDKNDDGGWTITVEVVESRRIPETADVLAEYEVILDAAGSLDSYRRQARYVRGRGHSD
jgi:Gas vesicle synthesis protein GvpO